MCTFNITEKELKRALKFAKKKGVGKFNTIHIFTDTHGIGTELSVAKDFNAKQKDITEVEAW